MWYCICMSIFRKMTWPKFILGLIAGYIGVFMFSPSMANFWLAVILVCMIPFIILRMLMLDSIYKNSINIVDKKFVLNKNALNNEHCTVIYTPDEKIVVMDNLTDRMHQKRMFTLTSKQVKINKAWNRLCRIYDSFTSLDSLEAFYNYDTRVEVITIQTTEKRRETQEVKIKKNNVGPKLVEMGSIQADPFGVNSGKRNNEGSDFVNVDELSEAKEENHHNSNYKQNYVNINDIKKQEEYVSTESAQEEFVDIDSMKKINGYKEKTFRGQNAVKMGDLVNEGSTKVNVNGAEAAEISLLPGINIVKAKKIVEYRNLNGDFKSVDEFIAVANVKEHFIPKIKEMVEVGFSQNYDPSANDYEEGRIVDF